VFAQEEHTDEEAEDPEWEVDVEDPAPRVIGDEPATDDRTDSWRQHRRDDEHGAGLGPLGRWERPEQHGSADRGQHAAADTLEHAKADELGERMRLPAEGRCQRERAEREQERPLRAEAIANPARCRNPYGEREQYPITTHSTAASLAELGCNGQGDVDDRRVHDIHEQSDHESRDITCRARCGVSGCPAHRRQARRQAVAGGVESDGDGALGGSVVTGCWRISRR
jgi:hypothetical protein